MKLYEKLTSASFPICENKTDLVHLNVENGELEIHVEVDLTKDIRYVNFHKLPEEKLIELRNFLNTLLEEA